MNLYVESSALLRELLDGEEAAEIREALRGAKIVATSRLTIAEVERVLARLRVAEPELAARTAAREAQFEADCELWAIHPIDEGLWERCGRPFPEEPVRLLDAIHLATIEKLAGALPGLVVLTTDERVRKNAAAFGFEVRP